MHLMVFADLTPLSSYPRRKRVSVFFLFFSSLVINLSFLPASHQTLLPSFLSLPTPGVVGHPRTRCFQKKAAAAFLSLSSPAFESHARNTPIKESRGPISRFVLNALIEGGPSLPPPQNPPSPPLLPTSLRSGVDVFSHLLNCEKKIFLWGFLTEDTAASIAAQLLLLQQEAEGLTKEKKKEKKAFSCDRQKPTVELIINCRGGSINAGLALYDVMNLVASSLTIKTLAVGTAGHLAALLLAAGEEKERRATKNATIFLCESAAHSQGAAEELLAQVTSLEKQEKLFEGLLAKHTKQPDSEISRWLKTAQVFSAEESKEKGLIDEVVGGSSEQNV